MEVIKIYCDGACSGNQFKENKGGWGAVLLYGTTKKEISGSAINTTNNAMELVACIEPLKLIKNKSIPVEVYSDSQYLVATINEGWKKKKNLDLWIELDNLVKQFTSVKFLKVKGHSDNLLNCRADELARVACN